jgi:hypothetical protein
MYSPGIFITLGPEQKKSVYLEFKSQTLPIIIIIIIIIIKLQLG